MSHDSRQVRHHFHFRVVRHKTGKNQPIHMLGISVRADPRIEIGRRRIHQKIHGAGIGGSIR